MKGDALTEILKQIKNSEMSIEEGRSEIEKNSTQFIAEIARFDKYRSERSGIPEVIQGEDKTVESCLEIMNQLLESKELEVIYMTRSTKDQRKEVRKPEFKEKVKKNGYEMEIDDVGRTVVLTKKGLERVKNEELIAVISAGTSDEPVLREIKTTIDVLGGTYTVIRDVGVAGIHRLFIPLRDLMEKEPVVVIVVAGMEGTLPGVIAALIDVPVIAVPSPVGYGHGGKGEAALKSMLQSCSPGLTVVNIGNGFSAACSAVLIARQIAKRKGE